MYSKKSQATTVKKLLGTGNKINNNQLIEASRSGTNYFAKVTEECKVKQEGLAALSEWYK